MRRVWLQISLMLIALTASAAAQAQQDATSNGSAGSASSPASQESEEGLPVTPGNSRLPSYFGAVTVTFPSSVDTSSGVCGQVTQMTIGGDRKLGVTILSGPSMQTRTTFDFVLEDPQGRVNSTCKDKAADYFRSMRDAAQASIDKTAKDYFCVNFRKKDGRAWLHFAGFWKDEPRWNRSNGAFCK